MNKILLILLIAIVLFLIGLAINVEPVSACNMHPICPDCPAYKVHVPPGNALGWEKKGGCYRGK
jgi:hypothetical protein